MTFVLASILHCHHDDRHHKTHIHTHKHTYTHTHTHPHPHTHTHKDTYTYTHRWHPWALWVSFSTRVRAMLTHTHALQVLPTPAFRTPALFEIDIRCLRFPQIVKAISVSFKISYFTQALQTITTPSSFSGPSSASLRTSISCMPLLP
jgi:hypothetical protein